MINKKKVFNFKKRIKLITRLKNKYKIFNSTGIYNKSIDSPKSMLFTTFWLKYKLESKCRCFPWELVTIVIIKFVSWDLTSVFFLFQSSIRLQNFKQFEKNTLFKSR